jgi:hypothetical protein
MDDLFIFIIIVSIFFLIMFALNGEIIDKDVKKVKSSLDDKVYIVRDLPNSQDAANKLAELKQKILKFVSHMKTNYSDEPGVKRMLNNLQINSLIECDPHHKYKSYSVNKGEELAICLRHLKEGYPFNDDNSIMFTTGHELGHVMNKTVGHDESFWKYMKFNLEEMEKIGLYQPIDYSKSPIEYCGMTINHTPYDFSKK